MIALARRLGDQGMHFLLVGGGPLDDEIDRILAETPCPSLTRLGLRHDVDDLYQALDVCLMTSAFEGLPVFLLDGLARGIPCVATAVGDIPVLLADGGGVLVERTGDLDALAAGLESLRDPHVRAAAGQTGRDIVAVRFEIRDFCRRYATLFANQGRPGDAP